MAHSLDSFLPSVQTQDTRRRLAAYEDMIVYFRDSSSSMAGDDVDKLVDGLTTWVSCSNYKVSLNGLELLSALVDRLEEQFKPYVTTVLLAVVDRLGDSKDQVRDSAQELLLLLMGPASSPQYVFEKVMSGFTHKLWRVREQMCICLTKTLSINGSKGLLLSKFLPMLVKLLEDQSIPVRDASVDAIVEIYKQAGERVRQDISKKDINPSKLSIILKRMDEVRNMGEMVASEGRTILCYDEST